jgi:hypothetical protein
MSTQEAYTERQWTKEDTDLLPFGYKPNKILIADSDPDTIIYNATWYDNPVLALDPTGPWALIKQGEENEQVTIVHWEQAPSQRNHLKKKKSPKSLTKASQLSNEPDQSSPR